MSDQSKVDIDALASFGMDVGKMLKDYGDGLKDGLGKIGGAVTGFSGTNEAQTFSDYYFKAVLPSSNDFNVDVMKGLLAIHFGAIVQAANYREGDFSQAQAMDDVINEFNPAAGKDGVSAAFDKAQKTDPLSAANTDNQAANDDWKLPPPTNTPDNVCVAPSPAEQVRQHEKLYGKDERWHPADPNPPQPQPTLVDPPPPGGWPDNPTTTTV